MGPEQNSSLARFKLLVQAGPRVGEVILIDRSVLRVGRQLTNDLVISDAKVSRQHARLEQQDDGILLTDEGSSNGTYVNGIRIDGPTLLQVGDVVAFGASHLLVQSVAAPAAPVAAAPGPAPVEQRPERAAPEADRQPAPAAPAAAGPPAASRDLAGPPASPPVAASPSARTVIGPSPAAAPEPAERAAPVPAAPAPPPPAAPAASAPPVAVPETGGEAPPAPSPETARPAGEGFLQRLLAVFKRRG